MLNKLIAALLKLLKPVNKNPDDRVETLKKRARGG